MDWIFFFKLNMSKNINEELSRAVINGDLGKVQDLLSSGADVNALLNKNQHTLLHLVTIPEVAETLLLNGANVNALDIDGETPLHSVITKNRSLSVVDVLLKNGADVNMKNNFGLTPLHCAIMNRDGLFLVRKLLKHGANVNATDNKRNSVLFLVVKYYKNLEIIRELLEFDADINVRSSSLNRFFTPIDVAINDGDLSCAQLLIRITVLKNYDKDYRKISDLQSYIKFNNNPKLSFYLDECALEISRMKMDRVNNLYSLFDYVKIRGHVKPFYLSDSEFDVSLIKKYPIYEDILLDSLKLCIQRAHLLDKLKTLQISFDSTGIDIRSGLRQYLVINGDCLFKIGELLSNDDILNFLIAIYKCSDPSDYSLDKYMR